MLVDLYLVRLGCLPKLVQANALPASGPPDVGSSPGKTSLSAVLQSILRGDVPEKQP